MFQQPLGAGENQGAAPSRVKELLWQQPGRGKSARAGRYTTWNPACVASILIKNLRHVQGHLKHV